MNPIAVRGSQLHSARTDADRASTCPRDSLQATIPLMFSQGAHLCSRPELRTVRFETVRGGRLAVGKLNLSKNEMPIMTRRSRTGRAIWRGVRG